ncbi:MAG TPA: hypothetical protein VFP68_22965 [Burkholderiaceae bacterium]|nr:hypothetical protein [Burkholderiaceae bacterium]
MDDATMHALAAVLAWLEMVLSYRIVRDCRSVTVMHVTSAMEVVRLIESGLRAPRSRAPRSSPPRFHARAPVALSTTDREIGPTQRRLTWIAAIGLLLRCCPRRHDPRPSR